MMTNNHRRLLSSLGMLVLLGGSLPALAASAPVPAYYTITPTMENKTVTLTGYDLTVEQVVDVARHGAKVKYAPEAIKKAADAYGLLQQAGAENIPVYGLNRGYGAEREVTVKKTPAQHIEELGGSGARDGALPEIDEEELVRAFLVIRANTVPHNTSSPEFMDMLVDMINKRVTPVMYSRGSVGEGDLPLTSNFVATMFGRGEAYYQGQRMKAADALKKAGLKPLTTEPGGGTTNSYASALAALMVADGRAVLEWADLIYAMDKIAMNSSVTPMTAAVQAKRPFKWVNWDADRVMDMLRGSYLFEVDPKRILQDPESMRASYIRQGSAWQAWANLRDNVVLQMNSSEQNPSIIVGAKPEDSWQLSTPQLMQYRVKGGPLSKGLSGYVISTANWDPYPMANEMEYFSLALANMGAAIAQRIERFSDRGPTPFFTGVKIADVLTPQQIADSPSTMEPFFVFMDIWGEISSLSHSLAPGASAADFGVADIEASTRLKGSRGRQMIDLMKQLLGYDLLISTYWMDVRKIEGPTRNFGAAPTAAWQAFRKELPWQMEKSQRPDIPYGITAYRFLKAHAASEFYSGGPAMPATEGTIAGKAR